MYLCYYVKFGAIKNKGIHSKGMCKVRVVLLFCKFYLQLIVHIKIMSNNNSNMMMPLAVKYLFIHSKWRLFLKL